VPKKPSGQADLGTTDIFVDVLLLSASVIQTNALITFSVPAVAVYTNLLALGADN